jgi:hypothetical protein
VGQEGRELGEDSGTKFYNLGIQYINDWLSLSFAVPVPEGVLCYKDALHT